MYPQSISSQIPSVTAGGPAAIAKPSLPPKGCAQIFWRVQATSRRMAQAFPGVGLFQRDQGHDRLGALAIPPHAWSLETVGQHLAHGLRGPAADLPALGPIPRILTVRGPPGQVANQLLQGLTFAAAGMLATLGFQRRQHHGRTLVPGFVQQILRKLAGLLRGQSPAGIRGRPEMFAEVIKVQDELDPGSTGGSPTAARSTRPRLPVPASDRTGSTPAAGPPDASCGRSPCGPRPSQSLGDTRSTVRRTWRS